MSLAVQKSIIALLEVQKEFSKVSFALGVPDLNNLPIAGESQAWVIELAGKPSEPLRDIGEQIQDEAQIYAVIIGIKSVNDLTGEKAVEKLEGKRIYVRDKLFDVSPLEGYERFSLAGAELLKSSPSAVFWVERFKTQHAISKESVL